MDYAWIMKGLCKDDVWIMGGLCIDDVRITTGLRMDFVWIMHGLFMYYVRITYGIYARIIEGVCMHYSLDGVWTMHRLCQDCAWMMYLLFRLCMDSV